MQPRADIARDVFASTETANRLTHGRPACDDTPKPILDWDLFGQPDPQVEFDK
jgi:hypothetical protein